MNNAPDSRLRELRLSRGLTQKQLADGAEMNIRQIQKIESGEYLMENITFRNALALADFLNIDPQELICKGWFLPSNTYDCGSFVVN